MEHRPATALDRRCPAARGTAAGYVLARYPDAVKRWRSASHDENVGLLVVIDGDEQGLLKRRQQLTEALKRAGVAPVEPSDPVAVLTPTWHIETWIAWLCGHRPIDEQTRYKADDPAGREVARKIERGEYSPRQAAERWAPPGHGEETHVPALAAGRIEVQRLGV